MFFVVFPKPDPMTKGILFTGIPIRIDSNKAARSKVIMGLIFRYEVPKMIHRITIKINPKERK